MDSDRCSRLRKVLRLDIHEIERCCEAVSSALRFGTLEDDPGTPYLDLVTGKIAIIPNPDGTDDEPEDDDWDRYLSFPQDAGRLEWRDLMEFADGLGDASQRAEVHRLANGCGAFRRVRDYLLGSGDIELKHAWRWFETRKLREGIVDWLHTAGIEPDWGCEIFAPPQVPSHRREMLEMARDFVLAASKLAGVDRIAITGALATDALLPSDVILVVAVSDDMEIAPLAKLRRQLEGKVLALGDSRGSEVLLTNLEGRYLGRICPWKDCRPGIRQACRADHCGRRHYLYDDLAAWTPASGLTPWPPIQVFPAPVNAESGHPLPADTAAVLLLEPV